MNSSVSRSPGLFAAVVAISLAVLTATTFAALIHATERMLITM